MRERNMNIRIGKVEKYLVERIEQEGAIHITLIDPDKVNLKIITHVKEAVEAGTSAIMIGGSIGVCERNLDDIILNIKKEIKDVPIILFPGNVSGISRYADAIWFMSLLNSSNTYYVIDAQAQGAIIVERYGLEAIPMGYIILGEGGAAGYIGYARPIPYNRPEIAVMYALAGNYLGMRYIYLEAGSGAKEPVPPEIIHAVKKVVKGKVIVGGGIRTVNQAINAVKAGADIIVTGTLIEEGNGKRIKEIIKSIRNKNEYLL
ncbi:MAG: geranylgeranylglyceryl/heptaprenylglyceryl phosphate synthase [Candidatus Verstraetearchaeota archaeon]|nr:geranylgeranylglyceryl/heptaprenylglyceryl phosphate synthase [Candidatus Verstraetearchaeota archaeon]